MGSGPDRADARKAAQDPFTIVYLGEFNSGASAISIPILNEANILQISPSNTYVGLTPAEGADKGEPDKYYPSGGPPTGASSPDHIQGDAQAAYQKASGCRRTFIVNAGRTCRDAPRPPLQVAPPGAGARDRRHGGRRPRRRRSGGWRRRCSASGADCVFVGGVAESDPRPSAAPCTPRCRGRSCSVPRPSRSRASSKRPSVEKVDA